jgi:hypothetical protein
MFLTFNLCPSQSVVGSIEIKDNALKIQRHEQMVERIGKFYLMI